MKVRNVLNQIVRLLKDTDLELCTPIVKKYEQIRTTANFKQTLRTTLRTTSTDTREREDAYQLRQVKYSWVTYRKQLGTRTFRGFAEEQNNPKAITAFVRWSQILSHSPRWEEGGTVVGIFWHGRPETSELVES